jgi:hypothetical protein
MKSCKTCTHHVKVGWFDMCDVYPDAVTGKAGAFCDIERQGVGLRTKCGREGKLWEERPAPAPRWWQFWLRK